MKTVDIDQVMAWVPCRDYPLDRIEQLFDGRQALTAQNIADLPIPDSDKLWALLRPEFLSVRSLVSLTCDFAEQALALADPDARSVKAVAVVRSCLAGKASYEDLVAARAAALTVEALCRKAARRAVMPVIDQRRAWLAAWAAQAARSATLCDGLLQPPVTAAKARSVSYAARVTASFAAETAGQAATFISCGGLTDAFWVNIAAHRAAVQQQLRQTLLMIESE